MRDGVEALRRAGVAGDEDEFACARAGLRELEIVIGVDGLTVFIDAKDGHVQVVARVIEVVRVAAEESDLAFGREGEAPVCTAFEAIHAELPTRSDRAER